MWVRIWFGYYEPNEIKSNVESLALRKSLEVLENVLSELHEDKGHTDSATRLNLRTIGAPPRFVISLDSSHHSGANIAEAEVDSFARPSVPVITTATTVTLNVDPTVVTKEKVVKPSIFSADSTSAGGTDPAMGGFTDLTGSDLLVGGIRTVITPDADLQKAASQISLSAEVRMRAEYNIRERRRLKSIVEEKDILLKARDEEIKGPQGIIGEVETLKECNTTLKKEKNELDVTVVDLVASMKVHGLETSSAELQEKMALHLEEKFYPHLLTTISRRRWLLTHDMELAIAKCLNSTKYLSTLRVAIGKAVKKEADYLSDLQHLQSVNFSLILKLKSNKDASIETIMNLLRLEDALAEKLGQRLALRDVFVPLAEPLSFVSLEGTSGAAPDITTALSTTFASASFIPPISIEDYVVMHADDQEGVGADVNPFPNVDDAELNIF
ncbi:hypothetical protein Tco_0618614 [Tanacetum coccineum]